MVTKTEKDNIKPYITKDGSSIRELMHPEKNGNSGQSLAEALVPAGAETLLHKHMKTEEIYHIEEGRGLMTVGGEVFTVTAGDSVYIPPETPHRIKNMGNTILRLLCCCVPPYSHENTLLVIDE
ncbi:MAG: cupin domain-containing protein [Deltaproteobacteria bacterium]|nr:cupin domain-containing protein [Deltaproteobacteria bacterium]MBN2846612.1 cupin domain-containing protein [Deltaproteobacteria bacterium]